MWVLMYQVALYSLLKELDLEESPHKFLISPRLGSNTYVGISMEGHRLKMSAMSLVLGF